MRKKRSFCLLLSAVIGTVYTIGILNYFFDIANTAIHSETFSGAELGSLTATAIVTPHLVLLSLAVIFNWVGFFGNKRGFALTAGILYSVAAVVFLMYALFEIPEIVLCFIGFARLKKINAYNESLVE